MIEKLKKKIASVRKKQSKSIILKINGKEIAKSVHKAIDDTL